MKLEIGELEIQSLHPIGMSFFKSTLTLTAAQNMAFETVNQPIQINRLSLFFHIEFITASQQVIPITTSSTSAEIF